ncbi:T9SS type A sorting domain-containing protein [Flavobacterium sp. GB2R13]|uniref:T9SS type A sorting domain-containing protein n=1 Tax=Flavobacterium algoris TaxID=3398733 RepID=UPI003A8B1BA2
MDGKSNYQVLMMTVILLLLNCTVEAQMLNRQMLSSQGNNIVLKNGTFVSQSIGQQSVFGSFSNSDFIVQQGFQHSAKSNFNKVVPLASEVISTLVYPTPLVENLNFKFSLEIKGAIKISILNVSGVLVYKGEKYANGTILSIQSLGYLPTGVYVVYLSASNYKYAGKILKN